MTEAFERGVKTAHAWAATAQPRDFLLAMAWADGWMLEVGDLLPLECSPEFVAGMRRGLKGAVYRSAGTTTFRDR